MAKLKQNTASLQEILNTINNLPEAGGADTSDATASADEIFYGETAYSANGKITGTFTIQNELTEQGQLITQISQLLATKATPSGGGIDTSDATATESDIYTGKTAYVKGEKLVGTNPYGKEGTDELALNQANIMQQILEALVNKAGSGSSGGVDTCQVTIVADFTPGLYIEFAYTDIQQQWVQDFVQKNQSVEIAVAKNTLLIVREYDTLQSPYQLWATGDSETALHIDQDGTIVCL